MPYVYLIGWSHLNVWYYGVEFRRKGRKAHPSNLWVTYFTSSAAVHRFRAEHGEPDVVQVRRTFIDGDAAFRWEQTVLHRMKVVSDPKWLNRAIYGRKDFTNDPERTRKIVKTRKSTKEPWHSVETKRKISSAKAGKPLELTDHEIDRRKNDLSQRNRSDPDFIARNSEGRKRRWERPDQVIAQKERMRYVGGNPAFVQKRTEKARTPEARKAKSAKSQANWENVVDAMRAGHQKFLSNPDAQEAHRRKHIESLVKRRGWSVIEFENLRFETYADCAAHFGVDPTTIRKWVKSGRLVTR